MIEMNNPAKIIFCKCIHCSLSDKKKTDIIEADLSEAATLTIKTDDLCEAVIKQNNIVLETLTSQGKTVIIACHQRAVRWLLKSAGIDPEAHQVSFINLHNTESDILKKKNFAANRNSQTPDPVNIKASDDWVPWFPVIDYDRCTHCRQCMSFCLFKVFELDEHKKVFVKNHENCKNNCPACARICPEIAIMFPKLDESPINGDVISEEDENKNLRIDMNAIMDGDMYSAIKKRNARNRNVLLQRKKIEKALEERKKCGCENSSPFKINNNF